MSFEYLVCQIQKSHVTFVNGAWQGPGTLAEAARSEDPFAGCPLLWDFLERRGEEGWAIEQGYLVGEGEGAFERLYLSRSRG